MADEWEKHRTFLLPGVVSKVDMSISTKIVIQPMDSGGRFRPGPQPTMGVPHPSQAKPGTQRAYSGFRYVGGRLVPVGLREFDGQRFADFATPWEKVWSALCNGPERSRSNIITGMAPVVHDTGQVMGYHGRVNTTNIVSVPGGGGEILFVLASATIKKMGLISTGFSDMTVLATTTTDGEVLNQSSSITRGVEAEDISPVDILLGVKMLVDLGAGLGAKFLTVLQRRSADKAARNVAAGVTRDAIISVPKKGPLRFEVLAEGPAIAGTNVPGWVRIKVGNREFLLDRNVAAANNAGAPIGDTLKHLGDKVQPSVKPNKWNSLHPDYPMSSLAGGLDEAERRILSGQAPLHVHPRTGAVQPGVYMVKIVEPGQNGWEFIIDTKQIPWRAYHVQIDSIPK